MNETKPSETKPKKVVGRSIAVALGIICILLIAVIAYFSITSISAQNSYNNLQNQNQQLQTWLDCNKTLLNQTQTWLEGNITTYNNYVNDLVDTNWQYQNIVNLAKSTVWVNGETVNIYDLPPTYVENASFAGYVSVQVTSLYNVTVEVSYHSHAASYENSTVVNGSGTTVFPVLPSSNISFYFLGPWELAADGAVYATVTITYYY